MESQGPQDISHVGLTEMVPVIKKELVEENPTTSLEERDAEIKKIRGLARKEIKGEWQNWWAWNSERQQREKLKKSQQKPAATGNRSRTIENPKYAKNDAAHLSEPELSYRCEVCYKLFAKKLELEWHMPEHTGVRPLPCGLCPMKFLTGRVLAAHHTRHHGVGSKWSRFNGGSSLTDSLKRTG